MNDEGRASIHLLFVNSSEADSTRLVSELERAGYRPSCARVDSVEAARAALEEELRDVVVVTHDAGQAEPSQTPEQSEDPTVGKRDDDLSTALIQTCPAFFVAINPDLKVRTMNMAMLEGLGCELDAVIGVDYLSTFVPEGEREELAEVFQGLLDGGEVNGRVNSVLTADGQELIVEWHGRPVLSSAGEVDYFYGLGQNVTERKRAEKALQQSEQRFREMADLLPDMIYETDTQFSITYVNRTALEAFGYTQEDLSRGISIADALAGDMGPQAQERLREIAAAEEPSVGTWLVKRRDGSALPCEIHTAPIKGPDGALIGFRGVMRDITERRKLEEMGRLAAVGELAAGVAHEFNNILAGMKGRAELAQALDAHHAYGRLIDTVLAGAARGAAICRKLVEFATPTEPERTPMLIEGPIDAALSRAAHDLESAGVEVRRTYDSGRKRTHADAGQLQEVLFGLIKNACQAMPDGGVLTIETACAVSDGGVEEIVTTISDTGIGMSPEVLPRVFEPFFTTKARVANGRGSGTGLGLSVSHGIISAHGGAIRVESEVGVGTTFEIRVAALEADAGEAGSTDEGQGLSVLLAEDEPEICSVVGAILAAEGFRVVTATTTARALEALQAERFDLIISDLLMPGGGGQRVLQVARTLPHKPPVMLISGKIENGLFEGLLDSGAGACLRKPFSLAEFLQTVKDLLGAAEQA